jgi:hypothetical protein
LIDLCNSTGLPLAQQIAQLEETAPLSSSHQLSKPTYNFTSAHGRF